MSPDDIAREALAIGDQVRRQLETDPYQPLRWDLEVGASLLGMEDTDGYYSDVTQPLSPVESKRLAQRTRCYGLADDRLAARGLPFFTQMILSPSKMHTSSHSPSAADF